MTFNSWIKNTNESVKENELNRILDKISKHKELNDVEKKFLDTYNKFSESHYLDKLCLAKNDSCERIKELLETDEVIICNLHDRDGILGYKIASIDNNFEDDECYLTLVNGDMVFLHDRYLYNIIYNMETDEYSLEYDDEFFEKIPVKNEN
jgi:hypothetical protein